MTTENIAVQVTDGVASSISVKLRKIADDARKAYSEIQKLQKAVDSLSASNAKLAASNQKLNSGATAAARAQAAQARASTQLTTAQNASAASAARLQAAQSNAAAAATRAQLAALRLANAQKAGVAPATTNAKANQNAAAAAAALEERMKRGGLTAKAYNNSLRGVPAQITDIVVSLQGGQAPFTVFLQQGGQLKDMFGGIRPAVKALATSFMGMINVWTLAAAAVVALGIAMVKFESQARQVNSILAQFQATGRGDLGKSFVSTLRDELNTLPGITKSVATEIINEFASVRNIGGPLIKQASMIVADFAAATGQDAPKAAKMLAEALQDPLKGAIKLDEQLGFLTIAQFKQINAFSKAGQSAKAQQVILDALNKTVKGLAEEAMTPLQKATSNLSNSWDKFMGSLSESKFLQDSVNLLAKMLDYVSQLVGFLGKLDEAWQKLSDMGPGTLISQMRGTNADRPTRTGNPFAQGSITGPDGRPIIATQVANANRTGAQFGQTTKFKTDAAGITGSKDKTAENRAKALAKVNEQLDNEIARLGMLEPAREKQQRFDQIEEQLLGRGIKLRASEIASMKARIATIVDAKAFQEQLNRVYEESVEPLRTYHATEAAIGELLAQKAITEAEANKQLVRAFETYSNIKDPMREYTMQLEREEKLVGLTSAKKDIATKLQEVELNLLEKGVTLRGDELVALQKRLELLQRNEELQQAFNSIYDQTAGAEHALQVQIEATNKARQEGLLTMQQYSIKMNELAVAQANLRLQSGAGNMQDVALSSFGKVVEGYQGMLSGLSTSFGGFFNNVTTGFADSFGQAIVQGENLGEALQNVAKNALSQLLSALIKLGIQYAINATIGQSVAAAATATSTALAATTASAWAPAAAAVSLASYGANAIPANAAMASTYAMSKLLASATGFQSGGFTGDGDPSSVAGVVHRREHVSNAATTSRNRELLEALSSGQLTQDDIFNSKRSGGGGQTVNMNVDVQNNAAGVGIEVQRLSDTDIRIIARDEMRKSADGITASNLSNSNSKTFRSLSRSTKTQRNFG